MILSNEQLRQRLKEGYRWLFENQDNKIYNNMRIKWQELVKQYRQLGETDKPWLPFMFNLNNDLTICVYGIDNLPGTFQKEILYVTETELKYLLRIERVLGPIALDIEKYSPLDKRRKKKQSTSLF